MNGEEGSGRRSDKDKEPLKHLRNDEVVFLGYLRNDGVTPSGR